MKRLHFIFALMLMSAAALFIANTADAKDKADEKKLSDLNCSTDQIAKFDGTNWVCAALPVDTNAATQCAGGEYLDGSGFCLPVPVDTDTNTNSATECAAGEVLVADGNSGVCMPFVAAGGRTESIIFVTTDVYSIGDGIVGGDEICQNEASNAGLPGFFVAFASTEAIDAKDRLATTNLPYMRPDGGTVAFDLADLLDSSLIVPVNIDADGNLVDDGDETLVWTGTDSAGVKTLFHCDSWFDPNVTDFRAAVGEASSVIRFWAAAKVVDCDGQAHWYCVEQ